jgi:hypothetical protein
MKNQNLAKRWAKMKYKGYRCARYEGVRGSGGIAPHIFSVSTRQKSMKSFMSRLLFP